MKKLIKIITEGMSLAYLTILCHATLIGFIILMIFTISSVDTLNTRINTIENYYNKNNVTELIAFGPINELR